MYKVLIVEDDDTRMQIFDVVFGHWDVTRAMTAHAGIRALAEYGPYDLVMLDHDLSDKRTYARSVDEETGRAVAKVIAKMKDPPFCVVHSWNPDGAAAMYNILDCAGVCVYRHTFGSTIGTTIKTIEGVFEAFKCE